MKEKYYTLREVEKITHISVFSLRKKIREKELRATKVCNHYLVKDYDLQTFIESGLNF